MGGALQADLEQAYARLLRMRSRRRKAVRASVATAVAALVVAGAAVGGRAILGWPAPPHVQEDLAAVDRGMPADLRLNPDARNARAVATTETATLYAASLEGGGYCSELVTAGTRGRGATCTTGAETAGRPIDLVVPWDEGASADEPVVIGGRANAAATVALEAAYADGSHDSIALGDDRFFVFEIPAAHGETVRRSGLEVLARDADGAVVARAAVPADWDDPPLSDDASPLYVSTRSDESDLTKVYGIEGHVGAPGAVTLELVYDDGTRIAIAVQPDGNYAYTVPSDRVDDFTRPQALVARDPDGGVVASAKVAAVAYWRGGQRAGPR